MKFGVRKLESWGYQMVKKSWSSFRRFDTIPARDGRTDRRTRCCGPHSVAWVKTWWKHTFMQWTKCIKGTSRCRWHAVQCNRLRVDLTSTEGSNDWHRIGLCSVLRAHQHSIGYIGDGFYRSKDPTNSIKVLKEATKENNPENKENTKFTDWHRLRGVQ